MWLPEVGVFSAIDELAYHNATSTLWGWPGQSPVRWADLDGRCGWLCAGAAVVAIGIAYGYIFAPDDAAAQRAAHPEATASPARGIALSAGVLAPVSALGELGNVGQGGAIASSAAGSLASNSRTREAAEHAASSSGSCAAGSLPNLLRGPGGKMLGEAVGHLKGMPALERANAFRQFAGQITNATSGQWSAQELAAKNATIFGGEGGEALVFDAAGNMYRGHVGDRAAFAFLDGGAIEVNFSMLRALK